MKRQGAVPNLITYNAVIKAYDKGSRPELALEVPETMKRHEVLPGLITYNALIST